MLKNRKKSKFLVFLGVFLFLISAQFVLAADPLGFEYANELGLENTQVEDPRDIVVNIVQFLLTFIGLVAVVMFIYGGWLWMTAAGNSDRVQKAKKTLISAVIGLIVIISAYAIVGYIANQLLDDLGITGCTDGDSRACGCGGTQICIDDSWGPCVGSDCGYNSGQNAFRVRSTLPSDEDNGVVRNINVRAFLNNVVDVSMTQNQINENFVVERIETEVDPETFVGTPIAAELIPLQDVDLLSASRTLGVLAEDSCDNEENTPNCLPEWSRFRVSINDGLSDIITTGPQALDCANGLCHFEFITDDSIDTATPTVSIIPTQICQDDGSLEQEANTVGAWARDDVGILEMRDYFDPGGGAVWAYSEPGNNDNYQYHEYQYDTSGFLVGAIYRFIAEADDMAGDTAIDSFEATIRTGHCCNGILDDTEEDIDCGGPDCDSCTMRDPMITFYSPDNGAVGNWITIGGRYFGSETGSVYFSDGSGGWIGPAEFPSQINANCADDWTNRQIIVVVPGGAATGPIRVVRDDDREDYSDNDYGPLLEDFTVNTTVRPGLCLADPAYGYFEDTSLLQGTGFDELPHEVFFGDVDSSIQAVSNAWTASQVVAEVPNLDQGRTSIFVEAGSEQSNFIDFRILVDNTTRPVIDYIDDSGGAVGDYVTIFGSNFMSYLSGTSLVEFDDGLNVVLADGFSFPEECQGRWWTDTFIVVKVPEGIDLGTVNVSVTNRNNQQSEPEPFDVEGGDPGPGICLLDPHNGLLNTAINIYGDNLDDGAGNGIVRFYNNIPQIQNNTNSWENQEIITYIPVGAETGPLRVVTDSGVSNSLNFTVGPCNDDSDCFGTEECCGEGTSWEGVCRIQGQCGLGSTEMTGYGWSFMTGAATGTLTCGGNSSRSACAAAGTCPNSPGTCQTTTDLDLDTACGNQACQDNFLTCASGGCVYNQSTNYCELTTDTCESSILGWTDASCNTVRGQALWQVRQPENCPLGTYLDSNGWCTIGILGNPTVCDVCDNNLLCVNDICVIPRQICPENSSCQAGQCVLDFELCECCCEVGESQRDCCLGLICTSGGCGDDPDFGQCTGCRVENNGNPNDVSGDEQILSDAACNCEGHGGKYCEIINPSDPNDLGACSDANTCDSDPYAPGCSADNTMCAFGQFCDDSCFCQNATPCDTDDNVGNGCTAIGNCDPDSEYCDPSDCFCKPGRSCDSDTTNYPQCDPDVNMCLPNQVCNADCICEDDTGGPGDPCDTNPAPGADNVYCDPNRCGAGYDCSTYDPINQPCGYCCCDMSFSGTENDTCRDINTSLFCANDDDVNGNCYDQVPEDGTDYGLCCGCTTDDECGNPNQVGCGSDTCCRERPGVISVAPADQEAGARGETCRNSAIQATFDTAMDISSFSGNVIVFGDYGIDQCPEGTNYLASRPAKNSRLSRAYYKTIGFIGKHLNPILPQKFSSAFTIPDGARNYCAINGTASGRQEANGGTVMSFAPSRLLDGDRLYYAVVRGDEGLDGGTGVRSVYGIGLNASEAGINQSPSGGVNNTFNGITYTNAYIWSFQTMADLEICEAHRVDVQPVSYLFQVTENSLNEDDTNPNSDTFDTVNDSDKVFVAEVLDREDNIITSIPGTYEFTLSWTITDTSVVDIINTPSLPGNQRLLRTNPEVVDGRASLNVVANSVMTSGHPPFSITGSSDIHVFLCNNPWPPIDLAGNWRPWRDSDQGMNCQGGATCTHDTNYEIYYCRDAGGPGTYDDLPAILSNETLTLDVSGLRCSAPEVTPSCNNLGDSCGLNNQGVCTQVLKESFFFRENIPDISLINLEGVANNDGTISLSWDDIPAGGTLDGYRVYYGSASGDYTTELEVGLTETHSIALPYQISGLAIGRTYYFAISAVYTSTAQSRLSNEISLVPEDISAAPPPNGLVATPRDSEVELSWQAVPDAANYRLYYGRVDNSGTANANRSYSSSQNIGSDNQIIVSGLTNGDTYYFAVTSEDANGNESIYSNEVSATPDVLAVGSFSSGAVVLTWNTGGTGGTYQVYYTVID